MPPTDETDDHNAHPASIPMVLGGVVSAQIIDVIDPTADAEADAAEQAFAAQKQNLIDALTIRNEASRVHSERRRANAELLGALGGLLRPSVMEAGFSSAGVPAGSPLEEELEQTLIAVLRESRMMAESEYYEGEESGDDESDDEGSA